MPKNAYYFPHDSNASRDPNILKMRCAYQAEGYGWYWMIIELLREQDNYKLSVADECDCNAIAMHCYADALRFKTYIDDCVEKFHLFNRTDGFLWSESLTRRMKTFDERSEKARLNALVRWDGNANAMQTQCGGNAKDKRVKEIKVKGSKEDKVKETKYEVRKAVFLTAKETEKIIDQFGEQGANERFEALSLHILSTGKKYDSHYYTLLNWERRKTSERNPKGNGQRDPDSYIKGSLGHMVQR
ncbi:MAG: DUF4373 domain-containing protein [Dehalococcoidales bacterium]|nr:DUF4373 domain-containing protein [Dehalococcoidales bacterium]